MPASPAPDSTKLTKWEGKGWEPLTDSERAEIQKRFEAYEAKIAKLEKHLAEERGKLVDSEIRRARAEAEAEAAPKYDPRVIKHAEKFVMHWHKVKLDAEAELKAMMKESGGELFP